VEASTAGEIQETDLEPRILCAGYFQVAHLFAEAVSGTDPVSLSLARVRARLAVILELANYLFFHLETTVEKLPFFQGCERILTMLVGLGRLR
jgi:hypothetical protein